MAARFYKAGYSMGYAGTKTERLIDLCKLWGWSPEEVEEADQEETDAQLHQDMFDEATQMIDTFVEPT